MWLKAYRYFLERRYVVILFYIMAVCFMVFLFFEPVENSSEILAEKGFVDLDKEKANSFLLNGVWEFYPNQLLTMSDFSYEKELQPFCIQVPGDWQGFVYGNKKMPVFGAATYRLKVLLPERFIDEYMAIFTNSIKTSYKIFVDNRLVIQGGKPSLSEADWEMGNFQQIGFFKPEKREMQIIVQVANYMQGNSSGIILPIRLGTAADVLRIQEIKRWSANTSAAVMIFSFFICCGLYMQYRKQRELFFLMVFCFFAAITIFFQRMGMLFWLFPEFPKDVWFRTVHIAAALEATAISCYTWYAFSCSCWRRLLRFINVFNLLTIILCLVVPIKILTAYEDVVFFREIIVSFFIVSTVFKRGSMEGHESRFLAFGLLWYPVASVLVILVSYLPVNNHIPVVAPVEVLMLTQLLFISARYKTRQTIDKIHAQRVKMNYVLLRSQINPHFIHNVLNTISALTLVEPKKAIILTEKFSQHLRLGDRFTSADMLIPLTEELKNIECYIYIEQVRFGERLKFTVNVAKELETLQMPPLSLLTIVENAVLHGISKKINSGKIVLEALREGREAVIKISNDGLPLEDNVTFIELIKKRPHSLGLKNTRQRLKKLLAANIEVYKGVGDITEFVIRIPL